VSACPPQPARRRAWPSDVPEASRAPLGEVEQRPALAVPERLEEPAPPLSAWEPEVPPEACDPSPHAPRCEPDPAPVFAAPWRAVEGSASVEPWTAFDDPRPRAGLAMDLGKLLDVVAGRTTRRPVLVRYRGRDGAEDYPELVDLAGAAGGRAWEEPVELEAFDPLEPS
jgi:hypothetical protein